MNSIALILLFIGFIFLIIGYMNQIRESPKPVVEYRYIPRTFEEEQKDPPIVTDLFRTMFDGQQPYIYGIGTEPIPKIEKSKIYDYNIAQYN
jgi:hypothetical protein